jgi:NADH dehydrogenase [ubiquinone] 1 alpha subcomplex assembly factor 2
MLWAFGLLYGNSHPRAAATISGKTTMSLLQSIARTLRIGKARYIVGHDLTGNAYLELPSLSGSLDPRHTRRSIQWKEKKEMGDYDQRSIPVQWVMWLRHTRRDPPTIEELARDRQRILTTQANAARLALQDQQRRQDEQQARLEQHESAKLHAQTLLHSNSSAMPTATVVDAEMEEQAASRVVGEEPLQQQERRPDDDVWAASRARLAAKGQLDPNTQSEPQLSADLQDAMHRRAARRAERSNDDAERERARREMSKSPLDAFVPMPKSRR